MKKKKIPFEGKENDKYFKLLFHYITKIQKKIHKKCFPMTKRKLAVRKIKLKKKKNSKLYV